MIGELILAALALAFCGGAVIWARWSGERVENADPARQGRPAE